MEPLVFKFFRPVNEQTLYLDKDGVLNKAIRRFGKLSSPRKLDEIIVKRDLDNIKHFAKKKRFNLVIISNQPDISRKHINQEFLLKNIALISKRLPISTAVICPHIAEQDCSCRKPKTGLILKFRKLFPNCHRKELFIGDQEKDEKCSGKLNIPFIRVRNSLLDTNKINSDLNSMGVKFFSN